MKISVVMVGIFNINENILLFFLFLVLNFGKNLIVILLNLRSKKGVISVLVLIKKWVSLIVLVVKG